MLARNDQIRQFRETGRKGFDYQEIECSSAIVETLIDGR